MTAKLINTLAEFLGGVTSELSLPCAPRKGDTEIIKRAPSIHKMRLPDSASYQKKAPYIVIQYLKGENVIKSGRTAERLATVRLIFVVYGEDDESGEMALLELMDLVRDALLGSISFGECFRMNHEKGIEDLVYTEDTSPFFGGEMVTEFFIPSVERKYYGEKKE